MDAPISKLRVWQIWKELQYLTVSAVCEGSSSSMQARLRDVAKKGNLEFLVQFEDAVENW